MSLAMCGTRTRLATPGATNATEATPVASQYAVRRTRARSAGTVKNVPDATSIIIIPSALSRTRAVSQLTFDTPRRSGDDHSRSSRAAAGPSDSTSAAMSPSARDKRTRLVDAGVRLVHRQGFHRTTLAELAKASRVPLGNVYYYFKTKEALGEAVIDQYVSLYESLRSTWDAKPDPKARLRAFIQASVEHPDVIARSGCPLATLSSELRKDEGRLADCATRLFADVLDWIDKQFRLLGKSKGDARALAVHLLSAVEGSSVLSHNFGTPKYAEQEAKLLRRWIDEL
jgi:TetR/AcrR family transcriptional regulator, transcriptional repressor for nem operon